MADQILSEELAEMYGRMQCRLREVVDYDPCTGIFIRRLRLAQRHQVGDRADLLVTSGGLKGYRRIAYDSGKVLAHRAAWLYVHGAMPVHEIDHINGDRGDNRIANLRDVTSGVNKQNLRRAYKNNKSGYLGVYRYGKKWYARVNVAGIQVYCEGFDSPEEAHASYLEAKRRFHEGCTI